MCMICVLLLSFIVMFSVLLNCCRSHAWTSKIVDKILEKYVLFGFVWYLQHTTPLTARLVGNLWGLAEPRLDDSVERTWPTQLLLWPGRSVAVHEERAFLRSTWVGKEHGSEWHSQMAFSWDLGELLMECQFFFVLRALIIALLMHVAIIS